MNGDITRDELAKVLTDELDNNIHSINEINGQLDEKAAEADVLNLKGNIIYEVNDVKNMDVFLTALRKKSCKIAFWGDSITAGANSVDWNSNYVNAFTQKIKAQFPTVVFSTSNFGVGGRTIADASDSTYTSPDKFTASWATTNGKTWRDYVKDFAPDLLVIAFGMNTDTSIAQSVGYYLELIKQYINTWIKVPSLLLVTNYLPREEWATSDGRLDRLCHMRHTKSYAIQNSFTVLDIGNRFRKLVDGIAENNYIAQRYLNFEQFTGSNIKTSTFSVKNFEIHFTTTFSSTTNISIQFGNQNELKISKTKADWLIGGNSKTSATINVTDGSHTITVTRTDETILLTIDSTTYTLKYYGDFRNGSITVQKIGQSMDFTGFYCTGYFNQTTKKLLTVDDVLGVYTPDDVSSTRYPYGGNGVNHPSSKMIEFVYKPEWDRFIDGIKTALARQVNVPYINVPRRILQTSFTNAISGWGSNGGLNDQGLQLAYYNLGTTLGTVDQNYTRKISDGSYLTYHSGLTQTNLQLLQVNEFSVISSGGYYFLFVVTPNSDYDFFETRFSLVSQ